MHFIIRSRRMKVNCNNNWPMRISSTSIPCCDTATGPVLFVRVTRGFGRMRILRWDELVWTERRRTRVDRRRGLTGINTTKLNSCSHINWRSLEMNGVLHRCIVRRILLFLLSRDNNVQKSTSSIYQEACPVTNLTREHWIQRITFAAETNAADIHTQRDSVTDGRPATQYLLSWLVWTMT